MNKNYFFIAAILALMLLTSCEVPSNETQNQNTNSNTNTGTIEFTSSDIKKFNSEKELEEFLQKSQSSDYYGYATKSFSRNSMATMESSQGMAAPMASDSSESSGGGAGSYSGTNVQVAGVDEADFVKNDDKYIYAISQNKLVIVEAYPADNAKIVSETEIKGTPRDMFVNKDRLVLFVDDNSETYAIAQYDYLPRPTYRQTTHVYVYDISNKEKPEVVKDYNTNGYYYQSRMIGEDVYFIVTENVYYYGGDVIMPLIKEASTVIARPSIYYFDNLEYGYNFNTVASFNVFDEDDEIDAKTFMMGYTNTLFVSENNIFISYQKNLPYVYYRDQNENRFYDVIVPLFPSDVKDKIDSIKNDNSLDSTQKWDAISDVIENMYNNMDEKDKQDFAERMEKAISDHESKLAAERAKTVIHRIGISNGNIEYGAKGEVPGYLLNQFSMDEKDGNLRVATTTEIWARESVLYNNVFVLNPAMETIGKLEAVAPDERIYSTRFIGDRLYMVTFKRIDPFFVIDLTNPNKPEILGELKIPGFSDYLHPYDENHIIGVGKETEGNEWGGVSTKGIKVALFDVSDVTDPKLVDKYEIGDAGSDSEALHEHKAFLFDKVKNLLVLPVTEVKGKMEYDSRLGYYKHRTWQGAYVFKIDEIGFEVKGKITHNEGDESSDWYWYGSPNAVRRSLYMDDVLYTVSAKKIKANDLSDLHEIKEVKLPYEVYNPYPYPVLYDKEVSARGGASGVASVPPSVGVSEPAAVDSAQ